MMSHTLIRDGVPAVRDGEKLFPVIQAVELATGRRPHKSAVYRWMQAGRHGHRLPWLALGAIRMTSVESIRRWMAAVTAEADRTAVQHDSPTLKQREREIERVERELTEAGY